MSYGLSIDLGTSFTRAAVSAGGQTRMVPLDGGSLARPSVVRAQPDDTLIAGEQDGDNDDPFRTAHDVKRRLGDPTPLTLGGRPYLADDLLAAMLTSTVSSVTATEGGPPSRVMLTHPAGWDAERRAHFAGLPARAGLDCPVVTMTEPEAAATHYVTRGRLSSGDVVAVLDLGGGTFDGTVVRITGGGTEILGTPEGLDLVAGSTFDDLLIAHVDRAVDGALSALDPRDLAAAIARRRVQTECIRAKERLSRDDATNVPVLLPGQHTQVRVTRTEFEALISASLEATLSALHRTLRSARIAPEELTGVLLVGGSSRIPLVARRLGADLGRPVLIDPHPEHCVALGAGAIAGRGLSGNALGRRSGRPHRRRLVLAAAAAVVLAGSGGYAYQLSSEDDGKLVAVQPISTPTQTALRTEVEPTSTPSPAIATTTTAKPRPTKKATHSSAPRSPTPAPPKAPALPLSGTVLGLQAQCLDVVNARSEDGTPIQTTECNGTAAQIWNLRTDRTFRALGKCMDVAPAGAGAKPAIWLQTCSGAASQRWRLTNGRIINSKSDQCLDIVDNNPADRTPTELSPCRSDVAQKWKLSAAGAMDTTG